MNGITEGSVTIIVRFILSPGSSVTSDTINDMVSSMMTTGYPFNVVMERSKVSTTSCLFVIVTLYMMVPLNEPYLISSSNFGILILTSEMVGVHPKRHPAREELVSS